MITVFFFLLNVAIAIKVRYISVFYETSDNKDLKFFRFRNNVQCQAQCISFAINELTKI